MTLPEQRENREDLENFQKRKAPTTRLLDLGRCRSCTREHALGLIRRLQTRGYAPTTVELYARLLCDFDRWLDAEGISDLRGVLRAHVEAYKAHLRARGLSLSSQAQKLQAVSRLFEYLVDEGVLLVDPAASVQKISRKGQLPRRVPTKGEVDRLIAAADTSDRVGIRDRAMVEVLYGSALRLRELRGLTTDDVDLTHGVVRVNGKGNKERVVPLGGAAHWVEAYLTASRLQWARSEEKALFLTRHGTPLTTGAVHQRLLKLCKRAGLPRLSPHALRHAAATHMLAAGADIRYVQELLGHALLSTTQIYTRVVPAEVKETHERTHPRERER